MPNSTMTYKELYKARVKSDDNYQDFYKEYLSHNNCFYTALRTYRNDHKANPVVFLYATEDEHGSPIIKAVHRITANPKFFSMEEAFCFSGDLKEGTIDMCEVRRNAFGWFPGSIYVLKNPAIEKAVDNLDEKGLIDQPAHTFLGQHDTINVRHMIPVPFSFWQGIFPHSATPRTAWKEIKKSITSASTAQQMEPLVDWLRAALHSKTYSNSSRPTVFLKRLAVLRLEDDDEHKALHKNFLEEDMEQFRVLCSNRNESNAPEPAAEESSKTKQSRQPNHCQEPTSANKIAAVCEEESDYKPAAKKSKKDIANEEDATDGKHEAVNLEDYPELKDVLIVHQRTVFAYTSEWGDFWMGELNDHDSTVCYPTYLDEHVCEGRFCMDSSDVLHRIQPGVPLRLWMEELDDDVPVVFEKVVTSRDEKKHLLRLRRNDAVKDFSAKRKSKKKVEKRKKVLEEIFGESELVWADLKKQVFRYDLDQILGKKIDVFRKGRWFNDVEVQENDDENLIRRLEGELTQKNDELVCMRHVLVEFDSGKDELTALEYEIWRPSNRL